MVLPAIPLVVGAYALGKTLQIGSQLYNQRRQRELYNYQIGGYERQQADWYKNMRKAGVKNPTIRYPEFSYPGRIRSLQTGIDQSYGSSVGSFGSGLSAGAGTYGVYSKMSRWI